MLVLSQTTNADYALLVADSLAVPKTEAYREPTELVIRQTGERLRP